MTVTLVISMNTQDLILQIFVVAPDDTTGRHTEMCSGCSLRGLGLRHFGSIDCKRVRRAVQHTEVGKIHSMRLARGGG